MWRGVDRWEASLRIDARSVRYLKLITLTCASDDWGEFAGSVKRFTAAMRQRWPKARYFWWVEEQERGAPHVHMYWVNAPQRRNVDLGAWLSRIWRAGYSTPRYISRAQWIGRGAGYLRSYAKKQGAKAYQQAYESTPHGMHLYASSLKGVLNELLDMHVARWEARYDNGATWLIARLDHTPGRSCAPTPGQRERAACRSRYRAGRRLGRIWANADADSSLPSIPLKEGKSVRSLGAAAPASQLELFDEYVVWVQGVESLPW